MASKFVEGLKVYFKKQNHKEVKLLWERMQEFKANAAALVDSFKAENIGLTHYSKTRTSVNPHFFLADEMNTTLQPNIRFMGWNREKNLIVFVTIKYSGSLSIKLYRITDWDGIWRHVNNRVRVESDPIKVDIEMENELLFDEEVLKIASDDTVFQLPFTSLQTSATDIKVMVDTLKMYISIDNWDE